MDWKLRPALTSDAEVIHTIAAAADVIAGNRKGEVFYERRGFIPREVFEVELFGERVVERRWWLDAAATPSSRSVVTAWPDPISRPLIDRAISDAGPANRLAGGIFVARMR